MEREDKGNRLELDVDRLLKPERDSEAAFADYAAEEIRLADLASAVLMEVLQLVGPRKVTVALDDKGAPVSGEGAEGLQLGALSLMGVRGLRTFRAGRAVLSIGWEGEARTLDRILVELMAHRRAVLDDDTGGEALKWIQGKSRRGITARVAAMGDRELYANLCNDAHADPAPVLRLRDAELNELLIGPQRTDATRASLLMYAGFARDHAVATSTLSGRTTLTGVGGLDEAIRRAWDQLAQDEPPT